MTYEEEEQALADQTWWQQIGGLACWTIGGWTYRQRASFHTEYGYVELSPAHVDLVLATYEDAALIAQGYGAKNEVVAAIRQRAKEIGK